MKKVFLAMLIAFLMIGVVSCGKDIETTESLSDGEFILPPTGLSIDENSKTLSWDEVDGACCYVVYANGERVDEVKVASYDFSKLDDDHIVFNVKVQGSSEISVNIAYVKNHDEMAEEIEALFNDSEVLGDLESLDLEAFSEELVNKGMVPSQVELMIDSMEELVQSENPDSFAMLTNIQEMFDDVDNVGMEAMISASLTTIVKPLLEMVIDASKDNNSESQALIEPYEGLLTMLDEEPEVVVQSVMFVVEYIREFIDALNSDMLDEVAKLTDGESLDSFDASLFVPLKDNMFQHLKEEMPSLNDLVLFNVSMMSMSEAFGANIPDYSIETITKQSEYSLKNLELFYNSMIMIGETEVNAFVNFIEMNDGDSFAAMFNSVVDFVNRFYDNNADLIEVKNSIFTEEELSEIRIDLFGNAIYSVLNSGLSAIYGREIDDLTLESITNVLKEYLDFDQLAVMNEALDEAFSQLLDGLGEDGVGNHLGNLYDYSVSRNILVSDDMFYRSYNGNGLSYDWARMKETGTYYLALENMSTYETSSEVIIMINGEGGYNGIITLRFGEREFIPFVVSDSMDLVSIIIQGNDPIRAEIIDLETFEYELNHESLLGANMRLLMDLLEVLQPVSEGFTIEEQEAIMNVLVSIGYAGIDVVGDVEGIGESYSDWFEQIEDNQEAYEEFAVEISRLMNEGLQLMATDFVEEYREFLNTQPTYHYVATKSVILSAEFMVDFYNDNQEEVTDLFGELFGSQLDQESMNEMMGELISLLEEVAAIDYRNLSSSDIEAFNTYLSFFSMR